jgi:hypothetical protein
MRALLGAFWSLPLRFLTVPAMLYAGILAGGGSITADNFSDPAVILSGVFVGVALRFVDNLTIEFAIFPATMKIITKRGAE